MGNRPAGIGIRFEGPEGVQVNKKIETYLAGYGQSEQPTHPM
jgi:Tfp pilus assembly protein PilZ